MATAKVTVNGNTILDLTDATATADKILAPYTAYGADGSKLVGTAQSASGVKYIYTDADGEGAWDVSGYQYVSVDFAPVHDNKARMWIDVDSSDLTFTVPISIPTNTSYRYTGEIDWGDGSSHSSFDYNNQTHTHTYSEAGRYCVSAWRTGGSEHFCLNYSMTTADANKVVAIEWFAIGYTGNNPAANLINVRKIRWSSAQTDIALGNYQSLVDVVLPDTVTKISNFYNMYSLEKLVIPASVTTVGSSVFYGNSSMKEYHFLPITPPTIGASSFNGIPSDCKIYVPSASLSAYQTATNWSTYASRMVGE